MKAIVLLLGVTMGSAVFYSCKGDYTCVCNQTAGEETITIISGETKSNATDICNSKDQPEYLINCEVD